jgi:IS30 family transposase
MSRNYSNTNLSNLDISNIEFYLNENKRPSEIAIIIKRDSSGIRKEIKKYSSYFGVARKCSNCLNKDNCHEKYLCEKIIDKIKCSKCKYCNLAVKVCPNYKVNINCELLKKNHHVCNGCEIFSKCKKVKIKYHAETAIKMHNAIQRVSRIDTKLDKFPQEFKDYISNLIKNGISPDIILNTLPEKYQMFKISTPTLYDWIDKGLLDCCNLDLRNKVSRIRYGSNTIKRNTVKGHQLNGRSIENLSEEERTNRTLGIAEFDTVEGIKGGELLFTIMIPCFSLMLAFKIEHKTQEEIGKVLDYLEDILDSYFYVLFRKVIPDNGCEFTNFEVLEKSIHEKLNKRMEVYYTHTYASYEKPHIENNHILLRWLIEKGYDITQLSSDDILNIINRLNNYPRPKKKYKTPLQLLEEELGDYILELLNLHHIPIEELNMKDMIIKNQERTK